MNDDMLHKTFLFLTLTFCEPFDEQLTGLGKMESFCLTQNLLLNIQIREKNIILDRLEIERNTNFNCYMMGRLLLSTYKTLIVITTLSLHSPGQLVNS